MLPNDLDPECRSLCEAMNMLPGIETSESCCGHDREPFRVFFKAETLEALPRVAYWFDACHSGVSGWQIIAWTDCGMAPISFIAEGRLGGCTPREIRRTRRGAGHPTGRRGCRGGDGEAGPGAAVRWRAPRSLV